jgi:hypothetical protein
MRHSICLSRVCVCIHADVYALLILLRAQGGPSSAKRRKTGVSSLAAAAGTSASESKYKGRVVSCVCVCCNILGI